ncbi:hypothetical protein Tco_1252694 [Tanacetum coccineum]
MSQIKTKRRNVKTGVRRRLDAEDVSTGFEGFEDVSTGFTDIKSASIKVSSGGEHASWKVIAKNTAEEEAKNARREELKKKKKIGTQLGANWKQMQIWSKRLQEEDVSEADYAQRMVAAQQRQYMATYLKNQGGWKLAQIKKLTDEELKEKIEYLMRSMERFVSMDTEKESRKRTGVELQTESSKKLKPDTREDVSVPKEKDKEKGLQKTPESTKSGIEEDVEAYMEERVDEPSSEEFPMGSILQEPAPAKIVKWPGEEFERVLWDLKTIFSSTFYKECCLELKHINKRLISPTDPELANLCLKELL